MLVRSKKGWEITESNVTSERDYRLGNRRDFLKTLGIGAIGMSLSPNKLLSAASGFPDKINPDYPLSALKPTPYEFITSYNNFYEFGTDKSDPKDNANMGWKTEPWLVEIAGLVRNPGKFDV